MIKIGRGAVDAVKISRKGFFGQSWVPVILPFFDFRVPVMLPFSKIFGYPPPNRAF